MTRTPKWQREIGRFLTAQVEPFNIKEAAAHVGPAVARHTLIRYLLETKIALTVDNRIFVPAWSFFRHARALVRPQLWEIERGVLAPGHRLLPLYNPIILPTEIVVAPDQGPPLSRKTVAVPASTAAIYYSLFGAEALDELLVLEDPSNAAVDPHSGQDALVRLSVFDLNDFYVHTAFREGDYLECCLQDWWRGTFTMTHRPAADISEADRNRWNTALTSAFDRMFDYFEEPSEIPDQLTYTWFFGVKLHGRSFLEHPAGTIGEYLAAENAVRIVPMRAPDGTVVSTLWFEDVTAPESEEVEGNLSEILDEVGSILTVPELEGYMRDALFNRRDLDSVVERAFAGRSVLFADEDQRDIFFDELEALWSNVADLYDRKADKLAAPIRARLLALYDKQIRWVRGLDARGIDPSDLPEEQVHRVGEFFGMITGTIVLLNRDPGKLAGEKESLRSISKQLTTLERAAEEILAEASDAVDALVGSMPVYELKITLLGIRPPIWRRVRVPGSVTLEGLHRVIQAAMGWSDVHLHMFIIHGVPYAPSGSEDLHAHAEEQVRIADLDLQAKNRFRYIYDFGDDWQHDIQVMKILDAANLPKQDTRLPRILAGKRASPPEDCGGEPGYYELLEHADEEELSELVPEGWDPETFDIEWANRLLADEW